jgi:hypothetical protein
MELKINQALKKITKSSHYLPDTTQNKLPLWIKNRHTKTTNLITTVKVN